MGRCTVVAPGACATFVNAGMFAAMPQKDCLLGQLNVAHDNMCACGVHMPRPPRSTCAFKQITFRMFDIKQSFCWRLLTGVTASRDTDV